MSSETINPSGKRRTRQDTTDQRRREILEAALACFLENGVAGTTIEQIRIASKASHGSIYHLFRSKDEIALTLFVEGMRNYHQIILRALKNETTARGSVRAMITHHLQRVHDNPQLAIYLTRLGMADDLGEISNRYRFLNDEYVQAVWSHLEPFVERGEMVRMPPKLYIALVIGPTTHVCRDWHRGRFDDDLFSATDNLTEAAWKSLQPN